MRPEEQRKNGSMNSIKVLLVVISMIITSSAFQTMTPWGDAKEEEGPTRETPPGLFSISDIAYDYPSLVIRNGTSYDIMGSLTLPANQPLYLAPGERLRFSAGSYLNLTAPPLIMGSAESYVELVPLIDGEEWGGVNLLEGDPSIVSTLENVTIKGATIGLRTSGSDLRLVSGNIENCSRSGLESLGPIPGEDGIVILTTDIRTCTYYGIHLQKVPLSRMKDLNISDCGTGIRSFQSNILIDDSTIVDPASLGLFLVNSIGSVKDCTIGSSDGSPSAAQNLITLVNSTASVTSTTIANANVCISVLTDSDLTISDSFISNGFTDCIQALGSRIRIHETLISEAGESAIHIEDCDLVLVETDLIVNGRGSGGVVFSSLFIKNSDVTVEGGSMIDSGDAHCHLVSSTMSISNSTFGEYGNFPCILDMGSVIEYINNEAPSDVRFIDIFSKVIFSITPVIEVIEYQTKDPVLNAQVDITNRLDDLIDRLTTGSDGFTPPAYITVYSNTSTGTISYLPLTIAAMKGESEISIHSMIFPEIEITMELFPPNDPPTLNMITPVNGTIVQGPLRLEGYIQDDLGVHKLRYRLDQGQYETIILSEVGSNGYFSVDLDLGTLSKGTHELWIHSFDGSHLSSPSIRSLMVERSSLDDSDGDGIPDTIEDTNGNGIVDEGETDPQSADTDGDGLLDGIEIDDSDGETTDPLDADSDNDFLIDGLEDANRNGRVDINETDPNKWDSDGDGYSDLDDKYPLNDTRWKAPELGNEGSTTTLIMIVLIGILVIILVYALYQRLGGNPKNREELPEDRSRNLRKRDDDRRKRQRGRPYERPQRRDRP